MKPFALIIIDGYAQNPDEFGNAVVAAKTPVLDKLVAACPHSSLQASGLAVGLPDGQMGNSEVGHTNMGAGRTVYQELTRISKAITDGDFYENPVLVSAVDNALKNGTALHVMGLLSDGGVHSHLSHLFAMLELCKRKGLSKVYVHAFLDGRDVSPTSGADFVAELAAKLAELGVGKIASVSGRYYAMDRDNRWERVEKGFAAVYDAVGVVGTDPAADIKASYENGVTDEFFVPAVYGAEPVANGDSVVFVNFRPDRAREITRAFVDPEFSAFLRREVADLYYVCFTQYDASMPNVHVAFTPQSLKNTLGEYLSVLGKKQLRIAETEKYAHVTFFFNGGVETQYDGEDRVLIPSPKVATYDMKPEMSAIEVTDEAVKRVESGQYDVIILNYANCDMVGHTGDFGAAVSAIEAVDGCLGRLLDAIEKAGGAALITADHGNADKMKEQSGDPFTAHTTFPVPFIAFGMGNDFALSDGTLADITPTLLSMLLIEIPSEMTGKSLVEDKK
jgi:2,3-bisphosphoglycerate-independent phosphoglycerate mutase